MDDTSPPGPNRFDADAARRRRGVVRRDELGGHPGREAVARGLTILQPGSFLAVTQPADVLTALEGLRQGRREDYVVMGELALWFYIGGQLPTIGLVGVRHSQRLSVRAPLLRRRAASALFAGSRTLQGHPVVALDVAVIQSAAGRSQQEVVALIEPLVRERKTTLFRLRSRCRRGFAGSAVVRLACDELAGGSLEKAVRMLRAALELRGVTDLEPEVRFESATGASAYADLRHRPSRTLMEVDGYLDHAERKRFKTDRRRDRWLKRDHGETVLRVAADEVWEDLDKLADELAPMLHLPDEVTGRAS